MLFRSLVNPLGDANAQEGINPMAFVLGRTSVNVKKNAVGRINELVRPARSTIISAVGMQEYAAQR